MKYLLTAICLLTSPVLICQRAWTLEQCISYAVTNSPIVNDYKARSDIYTQDSKESAASLFPSVSAGTTARFNFGRGIDQNTNTYANVNSFYNSYYIGGSMVLFDGLASVYRVKMNKAARQMGLRELERVKDDVAFNTMQQFLLAQGYLEMIEICLEQLAECRRILEQTERMTELGLKAYPDVAEVEAQVASAQYNLTRNRNLYQLTLIRLKEQMNFPLEEDLILVSFETADNVTHTGVTPMELFRYASGNNPVAAAALRNEEISLYAYKAAKGSLFPSIDLEGGFNTVYNRTLGGIAENFRSQLSNKRGHYIGASVSIPIFNGLSRSSTTRRAALKLRMARNNTEQTMRTLYSEIEQTVADINSQAEEYNLLRAQTRAEELAYELSLRRYNEGLISAVELHTSANRMMKSRADTTTSLLLYMLKARLLEYYNGVPLYTE